MKAFCPECEIKFAPSKCEIKKIKEGIVVYCPNCEERLFVLTWKELLQDGYFEETEGNNS